YLRHPVKSALHVESDPPGARVYVDGRARGIAPLVLHELEAGHTYAIRSTLEGHDEDQQLVVAAPGDNLVHLRQRARVGAVVMETDRPGAHLGMRGQDFGQLPPAPVDLAPGQEAEPPLHKEGFLDQPLHVTAPATGERAVYRASLPLSPAVAALTIVAPVEAT